MKHLKSFEEKINEELNYRKAIATGAIATSLALGGGGYLAYRHDKNIAPTEKTQSKHIDIPNSFKMKEKLLTWGTDMYVTNDNKENFGRIEERTMNIGGKFEYFDNTGKLKATAKQKVMSLLTKIKITDENGVFIGSVEQELFESLIYTVYSIRDANDNILAKSKKLSIMTTDVTIEDLDGNDIIYFHKNMFTLGDIWEVNVVKDVLDKRLVIFIPSFITSAQNSKNTDNSSSKK